MTGSAPDWTAENSCRHTIGWAGVVREVVSGELRKPKLLDQVRELFEHAIT